jgi:hypothetical protein
MAASPTVRKDPANWDYIMVQENRIEGSLAFRCSHNLYEARGILVIQFTVATLLANENPKTPTLTHDSMPPIHR